MEIAASIKGASKEYKTGDTVITALQPTTFDFRKKELTLIIGPSGSGKTTLLSLLGCVIFPTSGEVYIDNLLVNNLSEKELARVRLKNIGFVFQSFNLLAPLNVLENVMHPLRLSGIGKKEAKLRAEEALKKVNMENRARSLPEKPQRRTAAESGNCHVPLSPNPLSCYAMNPRHHSISKVSALSWKNLKCSQTQENQSLW